jgi:uroporphyrin-III C-methyltransferase
MTRDGRLQAARTADSEVFYMAGRQLGALSKLLLGAGWSHDTAVSVVSRAGWPDQLISLHQVATLERAALLHAGRPTVVTVGAAAAAVTTAPKTLLTGKAQTKSAAVSI